MEGELIHIGSDNEAGGALEEVKAVVAGLGSDHQAPPEAVDQEEAFLSLPAFRMMCLSNPLLDTFFSSQLPASFKLEAPTRGSINGTSIWHDIPSTSSIMGSPKVAQGGNAPTSAPAKMTSFSNPSSPSPARTYSKDISTGVVGRLGGFLNTFLGEEVKSKVDELADSLGEKLNTKVVKGPLPSFAFIEEDTIISPFGGIAAARKKKSSGTLGMDDLTALEEERREKRRRRELEEQEEEAQAKALAGERKGIDINAAERSLRMATESIVEGTQTGGKQFRDDLPVTAHGEEEEDEDVVVDDDVVPMSR